MASVFVVIALLLAVRDVRALSGRVDLSAPLDFSEDLVDVMLVDEHGAVIKSQILNALRFFEFQAPKPSGDVQVDAKKKFGFRIATHRIPTSRYLVDVSQSVLHIASNGDERLKLVVTTKSAPLQRDRGGASVGGATLTVMILVVVWLFRNHILILLESKIKQRRAQKVVVQR